MTPRGRHLQETQGLGIQVFNHLLTQPRPAIDSFVLFHECTAVDWGKLNLSTAKACPCPTPEAFCAMTPTLFQRAFIFGGDQFRISMLMSQRSAGWTSILKPKCTVQKFAFVLAPRRSSLFRRFSQYLSWGGLGPY